MNDNIETKLQEAQAAVAEMRQELTKVEGDLARLDTTSGDLEKAVDAQIRLTAKRDILARRLEVATAAADELNAEMLLEKAEGLRAQVRANAAALNKARQTARAEFQKLIIGGELEAHQAARLAGMIEMHREVAPLLSQREFLTARCLEAERAAADAKRTRAIQESQAAARMQENVFEGNI